MTTNSKVIIALSGALAIFIVVFTTIHNRVKIVQVSSRQIFEGFHMTQEIQKSAVSEASSRQKHLDSINNLLAVTKVADLRNMLIAAATEDRQALLYLEHHLADTETKKIWSRIGEYARSFAEEKGYDLILGAQPNSNIIYGSPDTDVSEEFLTYINNRYEAN